MDYSNLSKNIAASQQADKIYAKWYQQQPDAHKAGMIRSAFNFVAHRVKSQVLKLNPFANQADITMHFIELTQKEDYSPEVFAFIQEKMAGRSEKEWQGRFRTMKKEMGWSYADIARFVGAESEGSIRASVNRKVPAFGKLAVCVFEAMKAKDASTSSETTQKLK